MISFDAFIPKWNNQPCDRDNYPKNNKYQCMDLMHQYIVECLGLPGNVMSAINAKTVYKNFDNLVGREFFNRYPIHTVKMQKGDIILWDGDDGHVAIFVEWNSADKFTSFDQNFPVGSKCHLQLHTMQNVLGVLRLKGVPNMDAQVERDYRNFNWEVGVAQMLALGDILGVAKPTVEAKPENKAAFSDYAEKIKKAVENVKKDLEGRTQELNGAKQEIETQKQRIATLEAQGGQGGAGAPTTLEAAGALFGKLLEQKIQENK